MKPNVLLVLALFLTTAGFLWISGCTVIVQPTEPGYRGHGRIKIISATYGRNCGTPYGNLTSYLAQYCDGRELCEYVLDHRPVTVQRLIL